MAIIRLAKAHTDVAISVNVPDGQGQIELVESEMLALVKGFKVNDWSLFG
jgi:hypothetical protein